TLIGSLVGAAATVGGALAGAGLWSLAGGWAAQTVVQLLLEWRGTRAVAPDLRFRLLRISPTTLRPFLALSGLVLLSQVSDVIDTQWDKLVLAHYVGPAVVASFQLGTMLVLQAKALAVLPLTPLLTAVAELGRSRSDEARRIYSELERCSFALGGAILSAAFAFGPAFVRLWLGADFAAAGTVVRLLVVAVALNLYAAPLALRAFGEEAHRLPAIGSVVNVVVNGALSLVLTRSIGLNGALYGSIAGNLAGTALFLVLMRRAHGKGWRMPVTSPAGRCWSRCPRCTSPRSRRSACASNAPRCEASSAVPRHEPARPAANPADHCVQRSQSLGEGVQHAHRCRPVGPSVGGELAAMVRPRPHAHPRPPGDGQRRVPVPHAVATLAHLQRPSRGDRLPGPRGRGACRDSRRRRRGGG